MNNSLMFSSKRQDWETPQKLFDELDDEFYFDTDVASSKENAKCANFIDEESNALKQDWGSLGTVFCNPPYKADIQSAFIKKAYEESLKSDNRIVLLIPARTDTARWHDYIFNKAEVRFLRGRLKFETGGCLIKMAHLFPAL